MTKGERSKRQLGNSLRGQFTISTQLMILNYFAMSLLDHLYLTKYLLLQQGVGWDNMAFVFLNRYLDLSEVENLFFSLFHEAGIFVSNDA